MTCIITIRLRAKKKNEKKSGGTHLFRSVSDDRNVLLDNVQRFAHQIVDSIERFFELDHYRNGHVHHAHYGLLRVFQTVLENSVGRLK